jgi:hypothetical protein
MKGTGMTPERMAEKLDAAARLLHPVLLGDNPQHATAVHDALNMLASVRLGLDLLGDPT